MAPNATSSPGRTSQLRAALVQTVESTPVRKRVRPQWLIAAIAAFALAGVGTGGAVSAAALAASSSAVTNVSVTEMAGYVVGTHAALFGTPFLLSGSGETNIDLGTPPQGASLVAVAIKCLTAGKFNVRLDGKSEGTTTCSDRDAKSGLGGSGWESQVSGSNDHHLTISAGSSRFVIWASWATEPPAPTESAAQKAEMSDGVVTAEEYSAAFGRFSSCMATAGHPLTSVDQSTVIYNYGVTEDANSDGTYTQCYDSEFMQVDASWQVAHEDQSETAGIDRRCLTAHNIVPAEHYDDLLAQLDAAGLTPDDCASFRP